MDNDSSNVVADSSAQIDTMKKKMQRAEQFFFTRSRKNIPTLHDNTIVLQLLSQKKKERENN